MGTIGRHQLQVLRKYQIGERLNGRQVVDLVHLRDHRHVVNQIRK
ncbi:hypothetical protein ACW185_03365 [Limosilactobacillus fermentum]